MCTVSSPATLYKNTTPVEKPVATSDALSDSFTASCADAGALDLGALPFLGLGPSAEAMRAEPRLSPAGSCWPLANGAASTRCIAMSTYSSASLLLRASARTVMVASPACAMVASAGTDDTCETLTVYDTRTGLAAKSGVGAAA